MNPRTVTSHDALADAIDELMAPREPPHRHWLKQYAVSRRQEAPRIAQAYTDELHTYAAMLATTSAAPIPTSPRGSSTPSSPRSPTPATGKASSPTPTSTSTPPEELA
jgi:hypothetical protein